MRRIESLSSGFDLSNKARFHHTIFVKGRGATDFFSDSLESRPIALQEAERLREKDGKSRDVIFLGAGASYRVYNPETDAITLAIHGKDGYHSELSTL